MREPIGAGSTKFVREIANRGGLITGGRSNRDMNFSFGRFRDYKTARQDMIFGSQLTAVEPEMRLPEPGKSLDPRQS
jgi:hypothetical protein